MNAAIYIIYLPYLFYSTKKDLFQILNKSIMDQNLNGSNNTLWNFINSPDIDLNKFSTTHTQLTFACEPNPQPWFALISAIPILIHILFLIPHWWKMEGIDGNRLKTFPLLLLQFWPQYRILRLLWKKSKDWKKEKGDFEGRVGCLGIVDEI